MSATKVILVIILTTITMGTIKSQTTKSVEQARGLNVGVPAPTFKAFDAKGNLFSLQHALKEGPVVIIFYRGFWCPVCYLSY